MSQAKEELDRVRESLKIFHEREKELAQQVGESTVGNMRARVNAEDGDAELFDRLSPAEILDLYHNHRDRWQQIMDARGRQGMRKLLGGRNP